MLILIELGWRPLGVHLIGESWRHVVHLIVHDRWSVRKNRLRWLAEAYDSLRLWERMVELAHMASIVLFPFSEFVVSFYVESHLFKTFKRLRYNLIRFV